MSLGILDADTLGALTWDSLPDWLRPDSEPTATPSLEDVKAQQSALVQMSKTAAGAGAGMPWGAYSAYTKEFQNALNAALKAQGKPPINADGYLGPTTCAAAKYADMDPGGCKSYGTYPPVTSSYKTPSAAAPTDAASLMYKPKTKANALVIGGLVGAGALVLFLVARKKGWIK